MSNQENLVFFFMMERKEIIIELENKLLFVKIIIILNKRKNYNNIKYLIFIYITLC